MISPDDEVRLAGIFDEDRGRAALTEQLGNCGLRLTPDIGEDAVAIDYAWTVYASIVKGVQPDEE